MSGGTKHRAIVFEWLSSIGLQDAIPKFKHAGITTPAQLMALGFDDFERIGIDALLDRVSDAEMKVLWKAAVQLKESKNAGPGGRGGGGGDQRAAQASRSV